MSIEQAYNSLRSQLAGEAKKARGVAFGAPSPNDYVLADAQINAMKNVDLLEALAYHEDQDT